jgi:hypothetical protein
VSIRDAIHIDQIRVTSSRNTRWFQSRCADSLTLTPLSNCQSRVSTVVVSLTQLAENVLTRPEEAAGDLLGLPTQEGSDE